MPPSHAGLSKAIRDKADRYLTEGRVAALSVSGKGADFTVDGSAAEPYRVRCLGSEWTCSCPAQIAVCAHIFACQKITRIAPERVLFTSDDDDPTAFIRDAMHERTHA